MRAAEAFETVAMRLQADLRTRFAEVTVRFVADPNEPRFEVADLAGGGGPVGVWADPDDDLTSREVEVQAVELAEQVANNYWPDDETPWPLCPNHPDHPLNPKMVRGEASWSCSRDGATAIALGHLSDR